MEEKLARAIRLEKLRVEIEIEILPLLKIKRAIESFLSSGVYKEYYD